MIIFSIDDLFNGNIYLSRFFGGNPVNKKGTGCKCGGKCKSDTQNPENIGTPKEKLKDYKKTITTTELNEYFKEVVTTETFTREDGVNCELETCETVPNVSDEAISAYDKYNNLADEIKKAVDSEEYDIASTKKKERDELISKYKSDFDIIKNCYHVFYNGSGIIYNVVKTTECKPTDKYKKVVIDTSYYNTGISYRKNTVTFEPNISKEEVERAKRVNALRAEIKEAVAAEDYDTASAKKKELDSIM